MKKLKRAFLLLLSCLFASTIALAACDDDDGGRNDESGSSSSSSNEEAEEVKLTMLDYISLDTSSVKINYSVGEAFTSEGLVVNATTTYDSVQSTAAVTGYSVDSSEFVSTKAGTYTIYVSYSLSDNTDSVQYAEYDVTVASQLPAYANISATYSGTSMQYELTSEAYSNDGVTIDLSSEKLTVKSYIGDDSAKLTENSVTDYSLEYSYNSGARTAVTSNAITTKDVGTYSVYVIATYTSGTESFTMEAQLVFYVVDSISSIAYNNDGTTSFSYGASDIGSDWTFTATFASGITKQLTSDDVEITAANASGSQTATVSYTYTYTGLNTEGVVAEISNTAVTTTVSYTVADAVLGSTVGFLMTSLSSTDDFSAVSYSAGDMIATNDLFSLVSTVATTTSIGKDSNIDYLLQNVKDSSDNAFSFTDMDNSNYAPDQGIKMSTAVNTSTDSGTVYTLTASAACKVQLYMTLANDSYNSDRDGTIYYCLNGGEKVTSDDTSVSARKTPVTITVILAAGDVLTIGFDNGTKGTAKLWLYGAQAQSVS